MLGKDNVKKLAPLSISNNTVHCRIVDMSEDVKLQVVSEMKTAPLGLFSIQLDELTDKQHQEGIDVFEKVKEFIIDNCSIWQNLCGVRTDGAPAMLGRYSGFQARVRTQVSDVLSLHCMIHRYALAAKTLSPLLLDVMSGVVKVVKYIKRSSLNTRLFREFVKISMRVQKSFYFTRKCTGYPEVMLLSECLKYEPKFKSFFAKESTRLNVAF
ncbi:hypothetical protein LOD99_12470 [Oopsacas minuta]|uniref:Uncharacterized protein n=1 Tax=Oopsacas minuta TaxID=111878 RepID=A0AAV7JFA2_9METZ|nr:hypothetical protein LOD99_12470 [Oopsacas minuta]